MECCWKVDVHSSPWQERWWKKGIWIWRVKWKIDNLAKQRFRASHRHKEMQQTNPTKFYSCWEKSNAFFLSLNRTHTHTRTQHTRKRSHSFKLIRQKNNIQLLLHVKRWQWHHKYGTCIIHIRLFNIFTICIWMIDYLHIFHTYRLYRFVTSGNSVRASNWTDLLWIDWNATRKYEVVRRQ